MNDRRGGGWRHSPATSSVFSRVTSAVLKPLRSRLIRSLIVPWMKLSETAGPWVRNGIASTPIPVVKTPHTQAVRLLKPVLGNQKTHITGSTESTRT